MYGITAVWAEQVNTRGSRGNDPDFERYLRTEYLGGATLAALRSDSSLRGYVGGGPGVRIIRRRRAGTSTRERVHSAVLRIVTTMIVLVRRARGGPTDREA